MGEPGINAGLAKKGDIGMPNMNTIGVSSVDKFSKMIQDKGDKLSMPDTDTGNKLVCDLSGH